MSRKNIPFALGASLIAGLAGSPVWATQWQGNDLCITFTAAPNAHVQVLLNGWNQIPGKSKCAAWHALRRKMAPERSLGSTDPSTGTMCLSARLELPRFGGRCWAAVSSAFDGEFFRSRWVTDSRCAEWRR